MIAPIFTFLLVLSPLQAPTNHISDVQKKEFIKLLGTLPHKAEFFTDDAVKTAQPYLPVLFALNEKDLEKYDIYPFGAISRGLCDDKANRDYAVIHFGEMRHPKLKLFWGLMLFDAGTAPPEVLGFLRAALKSETQSKVLSEIVGPDYKDFVRRLKAHRATASNGKK